MVDPCHQKTPLPVWVESDSTPTTEPGSHYENFVRACAEWSTAGAGGRVLIWFFWVTVTSAKQVQSASNCHQTVTKKKPRYLLSSRVFLWGLVGPEWLEHSTYGLRVRCSTN